MKSNLRAAARSALLITLAFSFLALAAPQQAAAQSALQPTADEGAAPDVSTETRALIEALRDDATREALLDELERIAAGQGAAKVETSDEASAAAPAPDVSLGRRLAGATQEAAESFAAAVSRLWGQATSVSDSVGEVGQEEIAVLWEALRELLIVIAATYAVFILLRQVAKPIYRSMGRTAAEAGWLRTLLVLIGSSVIDVLVVVVAWAAGYALALFVFGETGQIAVRQTLYLNAFLIVELVRAAIRMVLSTSTDDLRLVPISGPAARYLTRWLTVVVSILGYGQMLIVPIINQSLSFTAGRAVSVLLSLIVLVIAAALVIANRRGVAAWLGGGEDNTSLPRFLRFLARTWWVPALTYLIALFFIAVARRDGMLLPVLGASGQILGAILAGMALAAVLTHAISRGVSLPEPVTARLPLLEPRLNTFVPKALLLLRLGIFGAVAAFALHTIGLIDVRAWLESQVGIDVTAMIISVIAILLASFLVWLAISSWVDYRLNPEFGTTPTSRERTLLTLLKNAVTIVIIVVTLMFTLSEIGLDIAPLLASAGVLGLAIGFGAQKMVQDIITGIFIQFENAINVGDVITVGGTTGTVERLTIRSVSLRDLHGAYHIIPFSSVDMVSNYMREFAYHVCDMGIAYREDVEEAREAMMDAFVELKSDSDMAESILTDAEWMGVTALADSAVVVRVRIKTRPGKQWGLGRAYNAILKRVFDERGIEIPFPHQTIYFGADKDGLAPPLHVAMSRQSSVSSGSDTAREATAENKELGRYGDPG